MNLMPNDQMSPAEPGGARNIKAPNDLIDFKRGIEGTALLNLVTQQLEMLKSIGDERAELCLSHGHTWFASDLLKLEKLDPAGHCFENASRKVLAESVLTYVEGFACSTRMPVATPHAWAVTPEGKVVDTTWSDGSLYFGVPISTAALVRSIQETATFGVFGYQMPRWFMDTPQSWLANI